MDAVHGCKGSASKRHLRTAHVALSRTHAVTRAHVTRAALRTPDTASPPAKRETRTFNHPLFLITSPYTAHYIVSREGLGTSSLFPPSPINPTTPSKSYLRMDHVTRAALRTPGTASPPREAG